MPSLLDNPKTVSWSHSDSTADFYELPTEGSEMQEALSWLLEHYESAKLWMGLETEDGVELFLTCFPSRKEAVVNLLTVYDDELSIFEGSAAVGE
ncbi:MAG TPA: hypothetical protein DCX06_05760 [Opitutae bacterium]|nr:hypothetical protein [Opitutae bacterium]